MRKLTGSLGLAALIACCSQGFAQFQPGGPGGGFPGGAPGGGFPGGGPGGGFPGGPGGGFGRPGMGGMGGGPGGFDPANIANMMFDRVANGKSTLTISEYKSQRDPDASAKLAAWAAKNGITSGQVTREQFAGFMKERFAEMQANGGMRFGGAPGGAPGGGTPGVTMAVTSGPGGQPQVMTFNSPPGGGFPQFNPEEFAKNRFAELDTDKNNFINDGELQSPLKDALATVDTDKDGKVNLAEFTEFTKQQFASGGFPGMGGFVIPVPESERKVAVYRAGSLPKELPEWFSKLDTDKDAQVGLYEWKKGGKPASEFRDLDENSDGLVTVDEALIPTRVAERKRKVQENPGLVGALPEGAVAPNQNQGGWGGGGWGGGGWGGRGDWGRGDRGDRGDRGSSSSDKDKEREKMRESKDKSGASGGPPSESGRGDRPSRGDRASRGGPGGESPFGGRGSRGGPPGSMGGPGGESPFGGRGSRGGPPGSMGGPGAGPGGESPFSGRGGRGSRGDRGGPGGPPASPTGPTNGGR